MFGDSLYLRADDGEHGDEPWRVAPSTPTRHRGRA